MDTSGKKILIIEDERSLLRALELKLSHEGFTTKTLPNGEELLSVLKSDSFSLIISDLMMPKVDGFDVLALLKENAISIPVIILTNLSQPEDERKVMELGAKKFFVKSDTPLSTIIENVKQMIN